MTAPATHPKVEFIHTCRSDELTGASRSRLEAFVETFEQRTQIRPQYIVCSPGRVNLIGDHIDYHGFSVLPMSIENSIWLGCGLSKPQLDAKGDPKKTKGYIRIMNTNDKIYPSWTGDHSFAYGSELNKSHKWHHYVLCGYHGILANQILDKEPAETSEHAQLLSSSANLLNDANEQLTNLDNLTLLIDSNLEAASGLSSSSALVCASAVATSLLIQHSRGQTPKVEINIHALASSCPKFEHLIGTQGGGMDQAVIMTAQEGYAKFVEFLPELSCKNVRLPNGIVWLISHCGVECSKAATSGFNTRVLETKLGAAMIVKAMNATDRFRLDSGLSLAKIKDELLQGYSIGSLLGYLKRNIFTKGSYNVGEICEELGLSKEDLIDRFKINEEFLKEHLNDRLQLLNRCEHVFEEARRVENFKSICDSTIDRLTRNDLVSLGHIMNESHESMRDKYECSHPALDKLVAEARAAGAVGSRLTGAGWGGCIVTLVEDYRSDEVYVRLKAKSKFTFRTEPKGGCQIIEVMK